MLVVLKPAPDTEAMECPMRRLVWTWRAMKRDRTQADAVESGKGEEGEKLRRVVQRGGLQQRESGQ